MGAAGADEGGEAVGEVLDEAAICFSGCGVDFAFSGGGFAVGDVFGDGAGEEDGFLGDETDFAAEGFHVHGGDVDAVDFYAAACGRVEAEH